MSAWMHFIGRNYYDIPKFIEESERHGITRRIALLPLMAMSWQDMVLCVQQGPGMEAFSAFVEFPITRLVGITAEAQVKLAEKFAMTLKAEAPENPAVKRECGSYDEGTSYGIDASLSAIAHHLKELQDGGLDVGKVMIGCYPDEVIYIPEPYPRIRKIKHFRGFRSMNRDKFWEAVGEEDRKIREGEYKKRKNPTVDGTFYKQHETTEESPGIVQEVENYEKGEGAMDQGKVAKKVEKQEILKAEAVRLEKLLEKRVVVVKRYEGEIDKISSKSFAYILREGERIAGQQAKERVRYNQQYKSLREELEKLNESHEQKLDHVIDEMTSMMKKYKEMDESSQKRLAIRKELLDKAKTRAVKTALQLENIKADLDKDK